MQLGFDTENSKEAEKDWLWIYGKFAIWINLRSTTVTSKLPRERASKCALKRKKMGFFNFNVGYHFFWGPLTLDIMSDMILLRTMPIFDIHDSRKAKPRPVLAF